MIVKHRTDLELAAKVRILRGEMQAKISRNLDIQNQFYKVRSKSREFVKEIVS